MYNLKFDSFCISVTDYCHDDVLLVLDMDLKSESSLKDFLSYYGNHRTNSTSIDYELDGVMYHGHFGLFIYDTKFKARIYITTEPDDYESQGHGYGVFDKNILATLNNHKKALEIIMHALKRNEILEIHDLAALSDYLPEGDYTEEVFNQRVQSLDDYLSVTNTSIDAIRSQSE